MRAWEREKGRGDPTVYERDVFPQIQQLTVPQLMKLTGLSQFTVGRCGRAIGGFRLGIGKR